MISIASHSRPLELNSNLKTLISLSSSINLILIHFATVRGTAYFKVPDPSPLSGISAFKVPNCSISSMTLQDTYDGSLAEANPSSRSKAWFEATSMMHAARVVPMLISCHARLRPIRSRLVSNHHQLG
jgi:hypothetical protein